MNELWGEWEDPDLAGHLVEPALIMAWSLYVFGDPPAYYTKFDSDDGRPIEGTMVKFPFSYFLKGAESFLISGLGSVRDGNLPRFEIKTIQGQSFLAVREGDSAVEQALLAAAKCNRCVPLFEAAQHAWHKHKLSSMTT